MTDPDVPVEPEPPDDPLKPVTDSAELLKAMDDSVTVIDEVLSDIPGGS